MKKTYETPYLIEESFQLNAAIAGSCNGTNQIAIHYNENSCGFDDGYDGKKYQFFNANNCTVDLVSSSGGDGNDTLCYHGPSYSAGVTFISS